MSILKNNRGNFGARVMHKAFMLCVLVSFAQSAIAEDLVTESHSVDAQNSRLEFFKLIENKAELVEVETDQTNLQNPNRRPASDSKEMYQFLMGKKGNPEDKQKDLTYFFEVRKTNGNGALSLKSQNNFNASTLYRLKPGEIIRITEPATDYLNMLRLEKRDEGAWKSIKSADKDKPKELHFHYDWKRVYAINSHHQPVELALKIPNDRNVISVYNKPGRWTWEDCKIKEDLCVGWPDRYAKVFLFDTALIDHKKHTPNETQFELYYQVGFAYKNEDGKFKYGVGWIPSKHAERQINFLPQNVFLSRTLAGTGAYLTETQRKDEFKRLFIFSKNADSLDQVESRWSRTVNAAGVGKSVFDVNIAWDGFVKGTYNKLDQTFLSEELIQYGITGGIAASAPIFLDLSVYGSVELTAPASSEAETLDPAYVFKYQQWLNYTSPFRMGTRPLQFGLGAYYLSMLNVDESYGFTSLVGFQAQARVESPDYWYYFRFGAVGADLNLKFRNREFGAGLGFRLDPEKNYDSWSVFGEVSDLDYTSDSTRTLTRFDTFHLGLQKGF